MKKTSTGSAVAKALAQEARALNRALAPVLEQAPIHGAEYILNPADYAWPLYGSYLERYAPVAPGQLEAVFLGMNPGPWGMAQTGVPFGSPDFVRDFLGLEGAVKPPARTHPKRRILGLESPRTEVSGQRLWGGIQACFGTAEAFFAQGFVVNYCPLVFQSETGANLTPDKLPKAFMEPILAACDRWLAGALKALAPKRAIGVGRWAEKRLRDVIAAHGLELEVGQILHPSPASPIANRGWLPAARAQLDELGWAWPAPRGD
ncbi:MAG: single-stranded DNA-binding protein [Planctomycetota bacterium]